MNKDIMTIVDDQIRRAQILRQAAMQSLGPDETANLRKRAITISRQFGSEGRLVAQRLSERLGWVLWDRDLVDAVAKDAEVSRRVVEEFDERTISEIEILARTALGDVQVGSFIYPLHLAHAVIAIASHGNAIILGRGSSYILPDALSVRIIAREKTRVAVVMRECSVSRDEATRRIHESDRQRAAFIRNTYGKDINDPLAYDLMIRIDEIGIEGTVEVITTAMQAKCDRQNNKKS